MSAPPALGSEPAWTLAVEDATILGQPDPYLSFSIAGGSNSNGIGEVAASSCDLFQLTVTLLQDPANAPGSQGWGLGPVVNHAGLNPATSTAGHYWPFIVVTPAEAASIGFTMSP